MPVYRERSGREIAKPQKGQRVDIFLYELSSKEVCVIDAKYYDGSSLDHAPGWPDLVKQFFYAKSLTAGNLKHEVTAVRNYFIFPGIACDASPDMVSGGAMPVAFTCDGQSQSPSLSWTNGPTGTVGYAIAMHHIPGPGDTHWYWVVYNIPATTTKVAAGASAPGTLGTNSVNNQLAYAPPCSKGPGIKTYTYTVYALSAAPSFAAGTKVSRDVLLAAISSITLASSSLDVTYDRS